MKHKKILITVLVIIILLVLALGGVAFAYIKTDLFKTDEQLFYKYVSEIGKDIVELRSVNLENYTNKIESTPYESHGILSVNVTAPEYMTELMNLDLVNNMDIEFTGKTDKSKNLLEQKIDINYSDDVSFPIVYKMTGNTFGITSEKIVNGMIGIRDENLPELLQKVGINAEIPDNIETIVPTITMEQIASEIPELEQIILDNLTAENFSRVDENDFALTLTGEQITTILLQMLDELENSGILTQDMVDTIDNMTENMTVNQNASDSYIKIAVNKDKRIVVSTDDEIILTISDQNGVITIQITDQEDAPVITLQKTENENNLLYHISYAQADNEISFDINYTGLQTQTVNESYILTIAMEDLEEQEILAYEYSLNTSKTFVGAVDIEELNSDNTYILNDQREETVQVLIQQLTNQIVKVNNEQMQALGVTENPLIYATPIGLLMTTTQYPLGMTDEESQGTQVDYFYSTESLVETRLKTAVDTALGEDEMITDDANLRDCINKAFGDEQSVEYTIIGDTTSGWIVSVEDVGEWKISPSGTITKNS